MTNTRHPLEVRPDDPLVRWMGSRRPPRDLAAQGANVAWLGRASRDEESWVTGLGDDPATVVRLVMELAERHGVDGVTVMEPAFDLLPVHLRSSEVGRWCLWTLDPADVPEGRTTAVDLALDDPRIAPLLEHSDSAHIFPGHPRLVRWTGVVDGERLLACAGEISEPSGAAHIVSVCTEPQSRGQGLARAACRRIIDHALADGAPMIVLEMYTANEAGRRTYSALGFVERGRYVSGLLPHALPVPS
ncbi:MAG: GNAT family N-acetyltransferase [Actinomycetales bacterium]|nr:GNAT family N-acetyltransferase [Actinomycetales bacterium]